MLAYAFYSISQRRHLSIYEMKRTSIGSANSIESDSDSQHSGSRSKSPAPLDVNSAGSQTLKHPMHKYFKAEADGTHYSCQVKSGKKQRLCGFKTKSRNTTNRTTHIFSLHGGSADERRLRIEIAKWREEKEKNGIVVPSASKNTTNVSSCANMQKQTKLDDLFGGRKNKELYGAANERKRKLDSALVDYVLSSSTVEFRK